MPTSPNPAAPVAPTVSEQTGFAAQAARLVEAARANERAVRDLEEAAQILAAGVDDIAEYANLAEAVEGLADQVALVRSAADHVREAVEAAEEFAQVKQLADQAVRSMGSIGEHLASVAERAAAVDGRLEEIDETLAGALDRVDRFDLAATVERIDGLERKFDRVLELLERQGDAYAARVEPQLARLESVAEHMDAPAVADELADVLATNYLLFQAIDTMREQNAQAQDWFDAQIERRRGGDGAE